MCGAQEKSINHVFFECLIPFQIWAPSKYPIMPKDFSDPISFYKHGVSLLEDTKKTRFELFSMDFLVYLEKLKR